MRDSIHNAKILMFVLVLITFFLFIFGYKSFSYFTENTFGTNTVLVAGIPLNVDVADTPSKRRQGLGGRKELSVGTGMLFIFDKEGGYNIWMKDMNFPIDVIWINKEGIVVAVKEFLKPETYPNTFKSKKPAMYILETRPGFVEIYNIDIGDKIEL